MTRNSYRQKAPSQFTRGKVTDAFGLSTGVPLDLRASAHGLVHFDAGEPFHIGSFLDIGRAGHVEGKSSAGGGSIFFGRRVRTLREITVLNPDRTRVSAVRRMMLHPTTSNTADTSALRNPGPWTHL
jgi:hypothetical protein